MESGVNFVDLMLGFKLGGRYTDVLTRVAHEHGAAMLLASRLYAAEHGNMPGQLSQLVPAILPKVPVDPFVADDKPLHYRVDAAGSTVWSVGEDGRDNGGDKVKDLVWGAGNPPMMPPPPKVKPATRGTTTRGAATLGRTGTL